MIYIKKNFTCLIKSVNFKLIVLLFFILVFIYSKEYFENISFINCYLFLFSDIIVVLFVGIFFLINTLNIVSIQEENIYRISRLGNYNKYLKELGLNILIGNLILFITFLLISIIPTLFYCNGFIISSIGGYNINNLEYTIIFLLRSLISNTLIFIVIGYMMKIVGKTCASFLIIPYIAIIYIGYISTYTKSLIVNPFEILMLPGRLFLTSNYASYNVEMLSSIIILFLLFIISLISKMIVYFTMKEVSV